MFEQRDDASDVHETNDVGRFDRAQDGDDDDQQQQHQYQPAIESPCDLYLSPSQSWAQSKSSSIVTFDLRGTLMRTTTETLSACEPGSLLAHLALATRDDHEAVFVDCSPADFTLVVDYLCYGTVPSAAETRTRLACVADRLRMPALRAACAPSDQEVAPAIRAAIVEMDQLAKFIMASGRRVTAPAACREREESERRDRCQWAVERHDRLDQFLSAHPLTLRDRKRLCDEATALRVYILDAKITNEKAGRDALRWAKHRYSRIGAILTPPPPSPPSSSPAAPTGAAATSDNGRAPWARVRRGVGLFGDGVAIGVGICFGFMVVAAVNRMNRCC